MALQRVRVEQEAPDFPELRPQMALKQARAQAFARQQTAATARQLPSSKSITTHVAAAVTAHRGRAPGGGRRVLPGQGPRHALQPREVGRGVLLVESRHAKRRGHSLVAVV